MGRLAEVDSTILDEGLQDVVRHIGDTYKFMLSNEISEHKDKTKR